MAGRDDLGVTNWMTAAPAELPAILFADPSCPAAQAMFTPPDDSDAAVAATVALVWALGCTGRFLWPIPDKGLDRRLHRLVAPTLVVWGEQDRLISSQYAAEFGAAVLNSEVLLIPDCGHIPQMEQPEVTYAAVTRFLAPPVDAP